MVDARAGEPVEFSVNGRTRRTTASQRCASVSGHPIQPTCSSRRSQPAAAADVAVVVVGTNDEWETEGFDRETMDLPGRQDELVEAVATVNPNTVVVVNAGSPVTMDWAADDHPAPAPAVVTSFFAGQEQAEAMVDVLLGDADPGGRLPTTYPATPRRPPGDRPLRTADGSARRRHSSATPRGCSSATATTSAPASPRASGSATASATALPTWGTAEVSATNTPASSLASSPITVTVPLRNEGVRRPRSSCRGTSRRSIHPSSDRP